MEHHNIDCGTDYPGGRVASLAINALKTTYSSLRAGNLPGRAHDGLSSIPIRVVPVDGGSYEVIDGFKRLDLLRAEGASETLVILENASCEAEHKRMLLAANAPARTLTPLDEALVVRSLVETEKLSPRAAGNLLRKKKVWIMQRLMMATKLSETSQAKLGNAQIGPTVGNLLTALSEQDQDKLTECFSGHKLRVCEQQRLIQTWQIADTSERKALLFNPADFLSRKDNPVFSSQANSLEKRLYRSLDLIEDLASFSIPAEMSDTESRRLVALAKQFLKRVKDALTRLETSVNKCLTDTLSTKESDFEKNAIEGFGQNHQKQDSGDGAEQTDQRSQNCKESGNLTESCGKRETGSRTHGQNTDLTSITARTIQGGYNDSCGRWSDNDKNPAGTSEHGLFRGKNRSGRIYKQAEGQNQPLRRKGKAQIRDLPWGGVSG